MTKQRNKACKQDINRILLLDSDSLGFESFGFGILNYGITHPYQAVTAADFQV